jgi:hypothetical protein
MKIERFPNNPVIRPDMQGRIGSNINGPSLIHVPDWLERPLGNYYLYFAHHKGQFIRLAYADRLEGPWNIYEPGTLKLEDSLCLNHIASPDVHVDNERREIRMYFHGHMTDGRQGTKLAVSHDGIHFHTLPEKLGNAYFRVIYWDSYYYALAMPGVLYRSKDGLTHFERGPVLFTRNMRHSALRIVGNTIQVFYSNVGDAPERILLSTIALTPDWTNWKESSSVMVLEPELDYEGVKLPNTPSVRDWAPEPVRQLRDPAIFLEGQDTYLLYTVAGEQGIAIARLID